jgi:signal transduction histidine kinase
MFDHDETASRVHHGAVQMSTDHRRAHLVGTVGVLVAVALVGSTLAAWVDSGEHSRYVDELVAAIAAGITAVVGAVVALADATNIVGWLILAGAALAGTGEALTEVGVRGLQVHPGSVPGAAYLVTFGVVARAMPSVLFVAAVPAYFPDGKLAGPRWRWLRWALLGAAACTVVGGIVAPVETRLGSHWHGPFTPTGKPGDALQVFGVLGVFLTAVASVGAVSALVSRWRHRGPVVRQQLLLFACAVVVTVAFIVAVLVTVSVSNSGGPRRWVFAVAELPLPVSVAVATLNHGLYDLRRAANRSILWLLMTGCIAAIYVVVVVSAASITPGRRSWWPPAFAAIIMAIALVPLRDRLQRLVDRVVYGRWREPYEVLSGLAARLEAAADVDRLLQASITELSAELDLGGISVRDADGVLLAGEVDPGGDSMILQAFGSTVGELRYAHPDRHLSESETRLIRDLGRHLGGALHARALFNDLQRTRERLVLAREEERRRLRRDLHDGIGPALAGLTLKAETARAMLPERVPEAIDQLQRLSDQIRATVVDVRRVVEGLRPPALDELGLDGACQQAVARLAGDVSLDAIVQDSANLTGLPAAVEVAAYRIVLEAVTNIVRHAHATRCWVSLTRNDAELAVSVIDNGVGIAAGTPAGNGLATMRERAIELGGSLSIAGAGPGVRIDAMLPTHPRPRSGSVPS